MGFKGITKTLALLAIVSVAFSARAADDRFTWGGYFRAAYGAQVSPIKGFQGLYYLANTPGNDAKWRLGNEDNWAEFIWNSNIFKGEDGTIGAVHFMLGGNWNFDNPSSPAFASWGPPNIQQLYVELMKLPGLDARIWTGKYYGKREFFTLPDFQYWTNEGFGAGIEDLKVGETMAFSYGLYSAGSGANHGFRHDIQFRGIQLNPGGRTILSTSMLATP